MGLGGRGASLTAVIMMRSCGAVGSSVGLFDSGEGEGVEGEGEGPSKSEEGGLG